MSKKDPESRLTLASTTFHETYPGHHLQVTATNESGTVPPIHKLMLQVGAFNGYVEGWGLYAEQLADEIGMYDGDAYGRIGYLQQALFRAVRLVIDTGLHHKKWTRDHAVRRYVEYLGEGEETARNAIDRYCVWPGQACAYMIGKERLLKLREPFRDARQTIDYKRFHDNILKYGALPLDVLSEVAQP
jgi:uncharacterized protein (DUF885 family)